MYTIYAIEELTPEVVAPELEEVTPESLEQEEAITSELQQLTSNSEMVLDSLPTGSFICARCHLVHEDRQTWNRVHSRR